MKQITPLFVLLLLTVCSGLMAQDSTHKEITGKYKFPAGSVIDEVVVTQENGAFTMTASLGTSPLELIKGDSFNIVSFNGFAVFKRDDTKKINGIHIEASGYVLDGTKDAATVTAVKTQERSLIANDKPDETTMNRIRDAIMERKFSSKYSLVIGCITE